MGPGGHPEEAGPDGADGELCRRQSRATSSKASTLGGWEQEALG